MGNPTRFSQSTLSRRQFFRLLTAGAALPWLGADATSFRITREGKAVVFWLGNTRAWTIDPERFSGVPQLDIVEQADRVAVQLTRAFFPGTNLAADFECTISHTGLQWLMAMHTLRGEDFQVPFLEWLSRRSPATARWSSDRIDLSRDLSISVRNGALVKYRPDWTFVIEGDVRANLYGLGESFDSSLLQFGLVRPDGPALAGTAFLKRAAFEMERRSATWNVDLCCASDKGWKLHADPQLFDTLSVETGETSERVVRTAVFTQDSNNSAKLYFEPSAQPGEVRTPPSSLMLTSPRLALSLGENQKKSALVAYVDEQSNPIEAQGFNLKLGGRTDTTAFELLQTDGALDSLTVNPRLCEVGIPAEGEFCANLTFNDERRIHLNWATVVQPLASVLAQLNLTPWERHLAVDLTSATLSVLRTVDLLKLDFRFQNLKLTTFFEPKLELIHEDQPCTIAVCFPPQNIGEQAFYELPTGFTLGVNAPGLSDDEKRDREPDLSDAGKPPKPTDDIDSLPVKARIAEQSRLVFEIPAKHFHNIPFRIENLLKWSEWNLRVHPVAKSPSEAEKIFSDNLAKPAISKPDGYTSIELPYRLMISPHGSAAWAHSIKPVNHETKFTELWHTRLTSKSSTGKLDEDDASGRTIRAIWSPDFRDKNAADWPRRHKPMVPFRMPLDFQDRHELVHLTSNYQIEERTDCKDATKVKPFVPGAVQVDRLMLTSLGGWLNSRGAWEPPKVADADAATNTPAKILTVEEWRHIATMCRDHYVRVVYKGYLLPFGHRASLIKVTERKFQQNKDKIWGAYLRQRMYIVVRQTKKEFPGLGQEYAGRRFPWRTVEAVTLVTPTIDPPDSENGSDQAHFWPTINSTPFPFTFRLWDLDGRASECAMPVVFADATMAFDPSESQIARDLYNNGAPSRRNVGFRGQKIALAPSSQPGDSQYDVNCIKFRAEEPVSPSSSASAEQDFYECLYIIGQPFFYPRVETAALSPAAIRRISGNSQPVIVQYGEAYTNAAFDPAQNRGEVFLEIVNGKLDLGFGGTGRGDQAGGVVTPNVNIVGFSRKNGPVGGGGRTNAVSDRAAQASGSSLGKIASGEFDPVDFFGGALEGAKILGGISLWDIVRPLAPGLVSNLEKAPKMLEETLYTAMKQVIDIERRVVEQLDKLPDVVKNKFASDIQRIREGLTNVVANQTDLKAQAQLIRSMIQLVDHFKAVLENPNQLLETVLADLAPWIEELKQKVLDSIRAPLGKWIDVCQAQVDNMETQLAKLVLQGLVYADQIRSYREQLQQVIVSVRAQAKVFADLPTDPVELAKALLPALGSILAAQVPALAELEQGRKHLISLVELAKKQGQAQLSQFKQALKNVQTWAVADLQQAEQMVRQFELDCQIWIAASPEQAAAGSPLSRNAAQQMVRQAALAMRSALDVSKNVDFSKWSNVKPLLDIQRQVLTTLQQLQALILDPNRPLRAVGATALATPYRPLIESLNDLGKAFSIVGKALDAANLEMAFNAIRPLLPRQLDLELSKLEADLVKVRSVIQNADANAKQTLLNYELHLFDLWTRYQDPYKLAIDIFGLSQSDIDGLKALENQYESFLELAKTIQSALVFLKSQYDNLIPQLPAVVRQLLTVLLAKVTDALAAVAAATLDEELLVVEQQAIQAILEFYADLMRRLQHPLDELQELLNAKALFEELLKDLIPDSVTLSYDWYPEIKSFEPVFKVEDDSKLTISARVTASLTGKPPTFSIDGSLTHFTVNLIGQQKFIAVKISSLKFSSHSGSKPDCQVQIEGVQLLEALEFVKTLQELLSPKDGPFLEWQGLGIRTGYRFGIPQISVGAFSLQSLRLIAAITLPFDGSPARCEFGISDRDHPFLLSVGIFGGGGFMNLRLGLDGVEKLEGALEFGVVAEISIGIAKGGGYIVAGIYFSVDKANALVCGFVHAHGHVDVLGIISVDVDVIVQVCYESATGNVAGEAIYIVSIHLLFFSEDVRLHAHYQFAGSSKGANSQAAQDSARHEILVASLTMGSSDSPPAFYAGQGRETKGLGEISYDTRDKLAPPPEPGEYCDLADEDEWNEYRAAFAW